MLIDVRFTRGWTLQELLAPPKLTFYNSEWELLGHKGTLDIEFALGGRDLNEDIALATGIIAHYLLMKDVRPVSSIAERMC